MWELPYHTPAVGHLNPDYCCHIINYESYQNLVENIFEPISFDFRQIKITLNGNLAHPGRNSQKFYDKLLNIFVKSRSRMGKEQLNDSLGSFSTLH